MTAAVHNISRVMLLRPDARARYEAAAAELGVGLSEWVREALESATKRQRESGVAVRKNTRRHHG